MTSRDRICLQFSCCLSCPLSISLTGKDCRELTENEIQNIMSLFRELEKLPKTVIIESLEEYLRKEYAMYINGKWYTEPEIQAHVKELEAKIKSLEEQNKRLRETIARNSEEEYE